MFLQLLMLLVSLVLYVPGQMDRVIREEDDGGRWFFEFVFSIYPPATGVFTGV